MVRLKDKVAVITGAGAGIGHAIANRMAQEGAVVALFDSVIDGAAVLARELIEKGCVARAWQCDVANEQQVAHAINEASTIFGRLDILVNNAGISGADKPTREFTEQEWGCVQAVNVKGVFLCTKHAIPHLRKAGGGSIINLSSTYGLVGAGDVPPYHASKGAVRLMTKNDALIYAKDKIRVNSIHFIWTPMVEHFLEGAADPGAGRRTLDVLHPLGHMGEPDDIAWGAVYLASDEAKFVTGTELVIDGGYTAR